MPEVCRKMRKTRKLGSVPQRRFNARRLLHKIKLLAFEASLTIVFLYWLAKCVTHELAFDAPPAPARVVQADVSPTGKR
jgi:hypothetical protein